MPSPAERHSPSSSCSGRGSASSGRTERRATFHPTIHGSSAIGLLPIYTGFWGFYAACNIPIISPATIAGQITGETWTATTIYLTPTTLSAITFNFLMSLSGGMMAGYVVSKGDPFWTFSGGLCGVIATSAGNDLYHPIQAMLIGAIIVAVIYKLHYWVERRFKIDDAVGAVAVHGYGGFLGVVVAGFMLWGTPSSPYEGFASVTPWGNFIGAVIMFALGFGPVYVAGQDPRQRRLVARAARGRARRSRFQHQRGVPGRCERGEQRREGFGEIGPRAKESKSCLPTD